MKRIILPFLLCSCLMLASCTYHLDVAQGNILHANQIKQLKAGMSKDQVQQLLGTPVLDNSFNDNKWYYVYTFQKGNSYHRTEKHLVIQFNNKGFVTNIWDHYPL